MTSNYGINKSLWITCQHLALPSSVEPQWSIYTHAQGQIKMNRIWHFTRIIFWLKLYSKMHTVVQKHRKYHFGDELDSWNRFPKSIYFQEHLPKSKKIPPPPKQRKKCCTFLWKFRRQMIVKTAGTLTTFITTCRGWGFSPSRDSILGQKWRLTDKHLEKKQTCGGTHPIQKKWDRKKCLSFFSW